MKMHSFKTHLYPGQSGGSTQYQPGVVRKLSTEGPDVLYVQHATFMPSGMHGIDEDRKVATDKAVRGLVARGLDPSRAHALVENARMRILHRRGHPHPARPYQAKFFRSAQLNGMGHEFDGMGDDVPALTVDDVQKKGADFQNAHRTLIAQLGASSDDTTRMSVRNAVEGLYNDWTAWAVEAKGGTPPYQWNRTDPVDAILIAVRDDLRNTADLLAANKAQQVLGKQISDMGKGGLKIGFDLPWYAWLGIAAGAAIGIKAAL